MHMACSMSLAIPVTPMPAFFVFPGVRLSGQRFATERAWVHPWSYLGALPHGRGPGTDLRRRSSRRCKRFCHGYGQSNSKIAYSYTGGLHIDPALSQFGTPATIQQTERITLYFGAVVELYLIPCPWITEFDHDVDGQISPQVFLYCRQHMPYDWPRRNHT